MAIIEPARQPWSTGSLRRPAGEPALGARSIRGRARPVLGSAVVLAGVGGAVALGWADLNLLLLALTAAASGAAFAAALLAAWATRERIRAEALADSLFHAERQREQASNELAAVSAELRWTRTALGAATPRPVAVPVAVPVAPADATEPAARLAHEVAGPLTGIVTTAELALEGAGDPEIRAVLETIRDDALQAAAVSRSMLARARGLRMANRAFDAVEVACRSVALNRANARRAGVRLVVDDVAASVPQAFGDPVGAEQILDNLVRNAIAALPHGGSVRLAVRAVAGMLEVSVADDGAGMDAPTLARAFEPFFTTRAGQGTGLGLAISRDLAAAMDGTLTATSTCGRGTTVTLRVPTAGAAGAAGSGESSVA